MSIYCNLYHSPIVTVMICFGQRKCKNSMNYCFYTLSLIFDKLKEPMAITKSLKVFFQSGLN